MITIIKFGYVFGRCPKSSSVVLRTKKLRLLEVLYNEGPNPLYINEACVDMVPAFRFLVMHITDDLSSNMNTTAVVRLAEQ